MTFTTFQSYQTLTVPEVGRWIYVKKDWVESCSMQQLQIWYVNKILIVLKLYLVF